MKLARAGLGLLIALLINLGTPRVFYLVAGRRLLASANWVPGTAPPAYYEVLTVLVSVIAAIIAGAVAPAVVQHRKILFAFVCGMVVSLQTIIRFRAVLYPPLYPDAWPVTLAPALVMPLGAWLVDLFRASSAEKPLRASSE